MKEVFKIVAKKRIIGMLVMSGLFLLMIGTVFAAYTFQRLLSDADADIGTVAVTNKKFVNYSAGNSDNAKLRVDTVAVVEGITLNYTTSYTETSDKLFIGGKTYYSDESGTVITDAEAGAKVTDYGIPVYELVKTYNTIASIGNAYDGNNAALNCTIDNATKLVITVPTSTLITESFTITCTVDGEDGVLSTVSSSDSNHKVTLAANGLGFVVLDKTKTSAREATISGDSALTCSATSKKLSNSEIYLNQVGLEFTFTVEIPVYVRIHIQDAWKRTRVYSAQTRENYVLKDQISGVSPFKVVDNLWVYDESTNYVYLKNMYIPTQDIEGNYNSATFRFDVNEAYYYTSLLTSIYTEYIDVEVSFTVDIVQANRADAVWGIDPSTIA